MTARAPIQALFVALCLVLTALALAPARAQEPTAPVLSDDLRVVSQATELSFGGVGFAGSLTDAYQAYTRLSSAPAESAELRWVAEHGAPAGRIYAALLLWLQDEAAGRAVLTSMLAATDPVQRFEGCLMDEQPLGEVASTFLAAGPPAIHLR